MQEKIEAFIAQAVENTNREEFEYREWFVPYHLKIVEEIALTLVQSYPKADPDTIRVLAWAHDYSKPFARNKEEEKRELIPMVRRALTEIRFDNIFIDRITSVLEEVESKDTRPIQGCSIEAQIISSADGASHFFGPFFYSYFRNDPTKKITETMARVAEKATRDWERKIVLPEIRDMVQSRYELVLDAMRPRK